MDYDITFNELRCKDVVNTVDGKRLGKATDLVIDLKCAVVLGLVLPGEKKLLVCFYQRPGSTLKTE